MEPGAAPRLVCYCFHVTEARIREATAVGALRTVAEVARATRACQGCRSCYWDIEAILAEVHPRTPVGR